MWLTISRPHHKSLLQLPRELIIDIISELNCRDLYSMRLVNHEIHNLVHENESTIVRKYLSEELESLQKFFKPPGSLNLNYRIDLRYRLRESRQLASVVADRCCAKLKPQQPFDNEEWRKKKAKILRDKLLMGLFALYEYLDRYREVVLRSMHDFEACSTADFASLGFVLGLDQQRIFETFPAESFLHITQAWRILEGVAHSRNIPLSCKSTKYPYSTIKAVLVLGGLDRFGELISKPTLKERFQDLDAFNEEIWNGQKWKLYKSFEGPILSSVHHLAPPPKRVSSADFPKGTPPTAPMTFINRQHICEPSLAAVILRYSRTLDDVPSVDQYICEAVKEEGDPGYVLLPWNQPDNPS